MPLPPSDDAGRGQSLDDVHQMLQRALFEDRSAIFCVCRVEEGEGFHDAGG